MHVHVLLWGSKSSLIFRARAPHVHVQFVRCLVFAMAMEDDFEREFADELSMIEEGDLNHETITVLK